MSVIALPPEFRPSSVALRLAVSQRVSASPFGGSEEAVDLLNDRWLMSCELPARRMANGAWLEAFIGALRGQSNTVPLYHFARPAPLGTIRGNLTLSAAAAQGASSLSVTGCQTAYSTVKAGDMFSVGGLLVQAASNVVSGRVNLLRYSQDFTFWDGYYAKPPITNGYLAPDGSYTAQQFGTLDAGPSATSSGVIGYITGPIAGPVVASVWLRCETGTLSVQLANDDSNGSPITLTTSWQRFTYLNPIGISTVGVCRGLQLFEGTPSNTAWYIWGAQLEAGSSATAYTPTTTRAIGDVTIPITNRLRVAQPINAAVTWDKPTFNARLLDTSGVQYRSAVTEPVSFDFGEAI